MCASTASKGLPRVVWRVVKPSVLLPLDWLELEAWHAAIAPVIGWSRALGCGQYYYHPCSRLHTLHCCCGITMTTPASSSPLQTLPDDVLRRLLAGVPRLDHDAMAPREKFSLSRGCPRRY